MGSIQSTVSTPANAAMLTVGVGGSVPMLGQATLSVGVSHNNGQFDIGIIGSKPIPGMTLGLMAAGTPFIVGIQQGDFVSNHGQHNMNLEAGYAGFGASISTPVPGPGFSGVSLNFGPQIGAQISTQQQATYSFQRNIAPWLSSNGR